MTRSVARAIAPYAVILLLAAYLFYRAFGIAPGAEGQLGADFWPKAILLLTLLTCAGEIASKLLHGGRDGPDHEANESARYAAPEVDRDHAEVSAWTPWTGIALAAAYVFLLPELGYFLDTLVFVGAFIYLGNYRRPVVAASIGIVASLAFVFVFMKIVYVSLPMGVGPFGRLSALLMTAMGIK